MQNEINDINAELISLQHAYLELRQFLVRISKLLQDHGIDPPDLPNS